MIAVTISPVKHPNYINFNNAIAVLCRLTVRDGQVYYFSDQTADYILHVVFLQYWHW